MFSPVHDTQNTMLNNQRTPSWKVNKDYVESKKKYISI